MTKRRSLREAISMTPAQRAFIEQGLVGAPAAASKPAGISALTHRSNFRQPTPTAGLPGRERGAARTRPPKAALKPASQADRGLSRASIMVTSRLQLQTAEALRRASLERKLENEQPATTQAIIEVALQDWLRRHGYLTSGRE